MSQEEIRATLQALRPRIDQEFRAEVEGFFGSRARGDALDGSDLDVLVRFHDQAGLYDLVGLGDFLEGVFRCKVDIVSTRTLADELEEQVKRDLVRV